MNSDLAIRQLVDRVGRRYSGERFVVACLTAMVVWLILFLAVAAIDWTRPLPVAARIVILILSVPAIISVWLWVYGSHRKGDNQRLAVKLIEQRLPVLSNQLSASVDLLDPDSNKSDAPEYLRKRLLDRVATAISSIDASMVVSYARVRQLTLTLAAIFSLIVVTGLVAPGFIAKSIDRLYRLERDPVSSTHNDHPSVLPPAALPVGIQSLKVTYHFPKYTGLGDAVQQDNGNLVALAGTKAEIDVSPTVELNSVVLKSGGGVFEFVHFADGHWRSDLEMREDSNYQISLKPISGESPLPSIFTIQVQKDRPPEVHITDPKQDLLFTEKDRPKTVDVRYAMTDDYGVAQAELKYIKSTGEGDSAKFESGSLPIKTGGRTATGELILNLDQLKLGPGDSLVYHVEARDRNNVTGPGIGYSENLVIAVASPEQEKIALDDLRPDELGKMLISERMIIIHTERLHAQRKKMDPKEYLEKSNIIAAEQRTLKQSFSNLVEIEGGESEEASEAAKGSKPSVEAAIAAAEEKINERLSVHDHGIAEAPEGSKNTIKNIVLAVRAMWDAEGSLYQAETDKALPAENLALQHLKLAQSGLRYFSQTKVATKPVDLKRRYAGELNEIKIRLERIAAKTANEEEKQLRGVLTNMYDLLKVLNNNQGGKTVVNQQILEKVDSDSDRLLAIRTQFPSVTAESAAKMKLAVVGIKKTGDTKSTDSALDKARMLLSQAATSLISILDSDQAKAATTDDAHTSSQEREIQRRYLERLRN